MSLKERDIVQYVAEFWENESEYAGRMETWCFYCGEYQGVKANENNHKVDCVHLQAIELLGVCQVCGSGCCLNESHEKET